MSEFKAEFYETRDGNKPAKEFMLSQPPKMKANYLGLWIFWNSMVTN